MMMMAMMRMSSKISQQATENALKMNLKSMSRAAVNPFNVNYEMCLNTSPN